MLVRMYAALRLAFPRAERVLSTRESPALRDRLAEICITQMSAGSCTTPGGHEAEGAAAGQQFPVSDHRSAAEVARRLERRGHHVCWSLAQARQRPTA
jgi:2-iminoacetate synthase